MPFFVREELLSALGGSYGGGATSAVWTDGGAGGTFANNTGNTPNTATYTAAANAPSFSYINAYNSRRILSNCECIQDINDQSKPYC
ncbi:hypothetical protein LZ575_20805 [Antarcticibacterium sp. 1MA-6-2]|uniref:hypothetical protein n=1 Tax=Antarcticibacterium sp. 1MA-6-2 TaxID=2908210 RepID=UPI001F2DF76E|nr:hypothetical protein [Antarcticibacterium sp. 1MA-6-2]UJH91070.1 hypothetical protein LZ575_20805 [Antarcticibacterium sp. 1MA-6-2]